AGSEHAFHLAQRRVDIGHVAHRKSHGSAIKRVIGKRQLHHVAFDKVDLAASATGANARALQHRLTEIDAGYAQRWIRPYQMKNDVARAAAKVDDPSLAGRLQERDRAPPPALVHSRADHLVGRVVARRDPGEHFADVGAL